MARSSRQSKFIQLREKFPFFVFEQQDYTLTRQGLDIRFTFNLADQYLFEPSLFIPRNSFFLPDEKIAGRLNNIIFNLGMIELISYWKCTCSPKVIIRPFALHPEQISWWKNVYFNGLGEFFYLNSLDVTLDDFMLLENASTDNLPATAVTGYDLMNPGSARLELLSREKFTLDDAVIIPIGGGKDSAVTIELLGARAGSIPLIMNPRGASIGTIMAKGFSRDQFIEIRRRIDPELLLLNERGFLNGHTPFSALLAFVTVLSAIVTGHRHIALSNESSANEATIEGTDINHQYSKSFQFESDFRAYIYRWISEDINYFSFLRPLNELQIASLFSQFQHYHPVFKSCNAGSKTDTWCGHCAKCLFTYIILSPFLEEDNLVRIFGRNLLSDSTLQLEFEQLTGMADEKPFDCVGTIREVNLALCETIRHDEEHELPFLLALYRDCPLFAQYNQVDFATELYRLSPEHHLFPEFMEIFKAGLAVGKNE